MVNLATGLTAYDVRRMMKMMIDFPHFVPLAWPVAGILWGRL